MYKCQMKNTIHVMNKGIHDVSLVIKSSTINQLINIQLFLNRRFLIKQELHLFSQLLVDTRFPSTVYPSLQFPRIYICIT